MHENVSSIIRENVLLLRQKYDYSQAELAKMAQIAPNSLLKIESGCGNPRLDTLVHIADALLISVAELLTAQNAPPIAERLSGNQCLERFISYTVEEQRLAVQLIEASRSVGASIRELASSLH